jgi:hypothetical protein
VSKKVKEKRRNDKKWKMRDRAALKHTKKGKSTQQQYRYANANPPLPLI